MKIKITICFASLVLCACSPSYVNQLGLTPLEDQDISTTATGITVVPTVKEIRPFDLLVDMLIVNESETSVAIDPNSYFYNAFSRQNNRLADVYAYDPKELLDDLDELIANKKQSRREFIGFGWALVGLAFATAAIADNNDSAILEEFVLITTPTGFEMLNLASSAKRDINAITEERTFYDRNMIKPILLAPSDSLRGLVVFPRYDQAERLHFNFTLNDQSFEFPFRQSWQEVPKKKEKDSVE